jgi:hypothetical protein
MVDMTQGHEDEKRLDNQLVENAHESPGTSLVVQEKLVLAWNS